jgi:oligoendopeptidase F
MLLHLSFLSGHLTAMNLPKILTLLLATALVAPTLAAPDRADVPTEYKWDLSSMYASDEAWKADVARFEAMLPRISEYSGKLGKNGKTLLAALRTADDLNQLLGNIYVFAGLAHFQDQSVSEYAERFSQARALNAKLEETTAFMRPELLAIPPQKLERMIDRSDGLALYRHYFDEEMRMRDYTLSEAEERLLAMATDPLGKFNSVFSAFDNADVRFGTVENEEGETVELTKGLYSTMIFSGDPEVRKNAWIGLFSEYEKMGNFLAANYEGHVKAQVFEARARGFKSALQASTYSNGVPTEVYTKLISTLRENTASLQRYIDLRRHALGLEATQVWDLYAPVIDPTIDDVPWEEAKKIVAEALAPLGDDYVSVYWLGFEENWDDVLENRGKRGGAYSWGTYTSKPYFSMNYGGTFNDVSTLAHEYGHSIHRYLSNRAQPYVYSGNRIFLAEVASMTNEALMFEQMLAQAEKPEDRLFLLQSYLDSFRGSMFRQASFADFEMQAHARVEAGEALSKASLNKLYHDVFASYYGDSVKTHQLNDSEWSRIPHFLRNDNFYVYQYATSFVAATALAKMILVEGEPARKRYIEMLRAGSSDYPIETLKRAGVDMTTNQPILDALAVFEQLVDEFEVALQEI